MTRQCWKTLKMDFVKERNIKRGENNQYVFYSVCLLLLRKDSQSHERIENNLAMDDSLGYCLEQALEGEFGLT